MGVGLDLVSCNSASARPELQSLGMGYWTGLYRDFDGDAAAQRQIAALIEQRYAPVLAKIGLTPAAGEQPTVTTLRPHLIQSLGDVGDPRVNAEARRLFAALANESERRSRRSQADVARDHCSQRRC